MNRCVVIVLMLLASCGCASRGTGGKTPPRPDGSAAHVGDEAPPEAPYADAVVQMVTAAYGRHDVLRNAALLYRRNHAAWPQRIEDVAPYVHDVERYESITFTPRPGGELVIRYRMKQQIAGEGGGTLSVFPPGARWATPQPATQPRE